MKVTDPNGLLDGDVLYVHAEPGYNNIAEMTNQMMSMVSHFTQKISISFKYECFLGYRYDEMAVGVRSLTVTALGVCAQLQLHNSPHP
jgi:hypothetical protein